MQKSSEKKKRVYERGEGFPPDPDPRSERKGMRIKDLWRKGPYREEEYVPFKTRFIYPRATKKRTTGEEIFLEKTILFTKSGEQEKTLYPGHEEEAKRGSHRVREDPAEGTGVLGKKENSSHSERAYPQPKSDREGETSGERKVMAKPPFRKGAFISPITKNDRAP